MFIAAHNAPEGQKRLADYVCDGENDQWIVTMAADERSYFSAGTFHLEPDVTNGGIECEEDHGS